MLATAALIVLAYSTPSHFPATQLHPDSTTLQEVQSNDQRNAQDASAQQQSTGDGTVHDRNDSNQVNTGLFPDPEVGNRVVVPRQSSE
jgi:hypothetical protein